GEGDRGQLAVGGVDLHQRERERAARARVGDDAGDVRRAGVEVEADVRDRVRVAHGDLRSARDEAAAAVDAAVELIGEAGVDVVLRASVELAADRELDAVRAVGEVGDGVGNGDGAGVV